MCIGGTLGSLFNCFLGIINLYIVPLIFAVAFIVFLWGIFQYLIAGATNDEKRAKGQQLIIWGLFGFFIMISVWGIVNILIHTFGFGGDITPPLPIFRAVPY